jgi:hypothetical protein
LVVLMASALIPNKRIEVGIDAVIGHARSSM